jgi:perosamine synthetase
MASKMTIPSTKVCFPAGDRQDILARIGRCLEEGQVAQGANVDELERTFARYIGSKHALALSSGGSALEAGLRALSVQGKEVLVPTNTFLATAAAVIAAGGTVKLLDIDPETLSPSVSEIQAALGPNTAGVIVVHIGGIVSRDINDIRALCKRKGVWLFEDCAHAHGSALGDTQAGLFGIGGAYSFFSTKVITCGEGGALVTNDDGLADRVGLLRNYGKREPWVTVCEEFGLNWRLNELAAIVAVAQLRRLDEFIAWRARIAASYTKRLAQVPAVRSIQPSGRSSWYKYIVLLPPGCDRDRVKRYAKEQGVSLSGGVYDRPLHKQPVAEKLGFHGSFPNADAFCNRHVCLPIYFGMTEAEAEYVIDVFKAAIAAA